MKKEYKLSSISHSVDEIGERTWCSPKLLELANELTKGGLANASEDVSGILS